LLIQKTIIIEMENRLEYPFPKETILKENLLLENILVTKIHPQSLMYHL
jgi:hypothetical protein